jgi:TIR domain-containing protein
MEPAAPQTPPTTLPVPYEGAEPFVFISYKREDLPRIAPLLETVTRWGYRVWYDQGIPGGVEWDALIEEKVQKSSLLLLFLSQAAVHSKFVRREVKYGDQLNKTLLTVRLEPVQLAHGLNMLLSQYQMLDATAAGFPAHLQAALERYLPSAPQGTGETFPERADDATSEAASPQVSPPVLPQETLAEVIPTLDTADDIPTPTALEVQNLEEAETAVPETCLAGRAEDRSSGMEAEPGTTRAEAPAAGPAQEQPSPSPARRTPVVRVVSPEAVWPYLHRGREITLTWDAFPGEGARLEQAVIELHRNGTRVAEIASPDLKGPGPTNSYIWTVPQDLPVDGRYQIKVVARDSAGRVGEALSRPLFVSPATESGCRAGMWAGGILGLILCGVIFFTESNRTFGDLLSILLGGGMMLGGPLALAGRMLVAYPVIRPVMVVCMAIGSLLGAQVRLHPDQVGFGAWLGLVVALGIGYFSLNTSDQGTGSGVTR